MPSPENEPTPDQLAYLNELAELFERDLIAGKSPLVADYLNRCQELRRPLLRKLLRIELSHFGSNQNGLAYEQYLSRFPDEADIVREFFRQVPAQSSATVLGSTINQTTSYVDEIHEEEITPEIVGRFLIERKLGQGGFGVVYLAHDTKLDRLVALKFPRLAKFRSSSELTGVLEEARKVAKLKHPLLVAVYDVQEEADLPYIIQEYIDGGDLGSWVTKNQPTFVQLTKILVQIADAVGFAHQHGLTHCDLKLANVLMDSSGNPHVADFGLAVQETLREVHRGRRFGTPQIMAPEQVRGEGHRLDGRTDIWAIGVMMYELLVSKKPFTAQGKEELFDEILSLDPKPPRQIDPRVPRELERICLKCLSKRRSDRYNTSDDLRDDLSAWIQQSSENAARTSIAPNIQSAYTSDSSLTKSDRQLMIVPKGLRSFDANDSDFFLDLLPGPRHRDGLPESIRFWKKCIEEYDADRTFTVALIYGPSGCGKSSLVKAGLIPSLASKITTVYISATANDTESRILNQLQKHYPELAKELSLTEAFAEIRALESDGERKLLLVIDQFEQWLHTHPEVQNTELTTALRQSDGSNFQTLLLVRDDFYLSVNRLFHELEIELQEGRNFRVVDLFDREHAKKLLAAIGRAYGKFETELTAEQEKFVNQVVDQLAIDGKVISVRLALFSEMMKSRPYTPASLKAVGGVDGLGVTFLEEAFGRTAPPSYRAHEKAIRDLLTILLPDAGTEIKGAMRSRSELRKAAGLESNDSKFGEILRILDSELRLITPTDLDSNVVSEGERYYQLTHDYIVSSTRHWLMRSKRESLRGRAELRLSELATEWRIKPDNRRLPSLLEYLRIRMLTRQIHWSESERKMLFAALRFHVARWGTAFAVLMLGAFWVSMYVSSQNAFIASQQMESNRTQVKLLLDALYLAPVDAVPYAVKNLGPLAELAVPLLHERSRDPESDKNARLRSAVALANFGFVDHTLLIASLQDADPNECENIVIALNQESAKSIELLSVELKKADSNLDWRLKARVAICLLFLNAPATAIQMCEPRADPVQRTVFISALAKWHGNIEQLVSVVGKTSVHDLYSAICLGIGQISSADLDQRRLDLTAKELASWYINTESAAVHSTAGWALSRWAIPLPNLSPAQVTNKEWHLNSVGMTMIKLLPRNLPEGVARTLPNNLRLADDESLWLSDREVSRNLFQQFINDANYPSSKKPQNWPGASESRSRTVDHPVQTVSWYDAALFCNWLSQMEGLQPCYQTSGANWQLDATTSGYRLPFESEWEFACRAGTSTPFSSGKDEVSLKDYAVFLSNHTEPCASKMPNAWGLFDMHGNVYEWCEDWLDSKLKNRILRGGAFDYEAYKARSHFRQDNVPAYRSVTIGFRVFQHVRTANQIKLREGASE